MICIFLDVMVAWGSDRRRDIYGDIAINVWRRTDDQPQRAPRAQSRAHLMNWGRAPTMERIFICVSEVF